MKIAIYTIAKNEEQFVQRWYDCSKQADYHIIADTGSTDNTVELAKSIGINVTQISVEPFRFDDARNASLTLVPSDADYCIALDMDEVLQPGWYEELEKAFLEGTTRPQYRFITSWNPDGSPKIEFSGFRIHTRKGVRWVYPIHEVPEFYSGSDIKKLYNFEIHHRPDESKSRGQYLQMLINAVNEMPEDSRMRFYLGREFTFYKMYQQAIPQLEKSIELDWWDKEQTYDLLALSAYYTGNKELAFKYGLKALTLNPTNERLKDNMLWYKGLKV
jgi:glycosyltransferase involved in cell wall biosynthesis